MQQLPPNRQLKKINQVFKIKSGDFLPKSRMIDGDYNVYGGNGINGNHNKYNLEGENIIIGRVGAQCGNVRYVDKKIWLTDNAFYISDYLVEINKIYLSKFLDYQKLGSTSNSSAQPVISYKSISAILISLPPLSTQHKIVAALDETSAQITASKLAIQSQLDALDQLWQSSLSEVFENENWKYEKLGNIIDFNYGKGLDKSQRSDTGSYPVYGANGVMNYSEQYLFEGESIVVGRKGSAGAITKVTGKFRPSDVTYYVTLKKHGNIDFIYYLLSTLNLSSYAQGVKPGINRNTIYDLDIKYPDINTQKQIIIQLDNLNQNITTLKAQYKAQLKHFDDLRASVLDQAFKGELVK